MSTRSALAPLVTRLRKLLSIGRKEAAWLEQIETCPKAYRPGAHLVREGDEWRSVLVVRSGWAARYVMLPDGRRQIINLSLPGDVLGLHAALHRPALASVMALTPVEAAALPSTLEIKMGKEQPKLAAALSWVSSRDLHEQLIRQGLRNASARLAHFLYSHWRRLLLAEIAQEPRYVLPLSQGGIADALNLSRVHLNRIMGQFVRGGVVKPNGKSVIVLDPERLRGFGGDDFAVT